MISIIIPTKNEAVHLPRLLKNLEAQTFKDYELIVADAGSEDTTRDIAVAAGARVVEGGLPGIGRNRGAAVAQGETLVFFDADVSLSSSKFLEDGLREMEKRQLDVAACLVKPLSRKPIDRAFHEIYNAYALAMENVKPHAPGACIFSRTSVFKKLGGFDERVTYAEDCDFVQRVRKEGYAFALLRAHPVGISIRRLEKEGRLLFAMKYLYGEFHILANGGMKGSKLFHYEMGGNGIDEDVYDEKDSRR